MCAIQKACLELEENYQPAITFIVVTKRHHGRFIVVSPRDGVDCFFNISFFYLFAKKQNKNKKERKQSGTVESNFVVFPGLISLLEKLKKM